MSTEFSFPFCDVLNGDGIKLRSLVRYDSNLTNKIKRTYETVDTGVDDGNLDFHGHRLVLTLLYKGAHY